MRDPQLIAHAQFHATFDHFEFDGSSSIGFELTFVVFQILGVGHLRFDVRTPVEDEPSVFSNQLLADFTIAQCHNTEHIPAAVLCFCRFLTLP